MKNDTEGRFAPETPISQMTAGQLADYLNSHARTPGAPAAGTEAPAARTAEEMREDLEDLAHLVLASRHLACIKGGKNVFETACKLDTLLHEMLTDFSEVYGRDPADYQED